MIDTLETLEGEVWRLHNCGIYVSNLGRVYLPKNKTHPSHYTVGSINGSSYLQIRKDYKDYLVHRLVAECFIPNPNNYPTVDHINRDKTDNRVENLRWTSYKMQTKNRDTSNYYNNAKSKKVLMIDVNTNEIVKVWESTAECGRNGFYHSAVSKCCLNKFNRIGNNIYKNYKWQYA